MTSVLVVHEAYAQAGGEDTAFAADVEVLRANGHAVTVWKEDNGPIASWSYPRQATLFLRTSWSHRSYRHIRRLIRTVQPDVVHFHNTLPLISPSAIRGAHAEGAAVVMTLHNYRLLCPSGLFFRQGHACEDCLGSLAYGVIHGCYRNSRPQTAAVAMMLSVHRALGTWRRCVDAYIVMTEFMRSKQIEAGLPADRIHLRPHFLPTPPVMPAHSGGDYAVFLGRLSPEKGVDTLLEASSMLKLPVKIIGAGPMQSRVTQMAASAPSLIHPLGQLPHHEAMSFLAGATALIFPSKCYESFALAVAEAMSLGVPVVATDLGGRSEFVVDSVNGFLFKPGDASALAELTNRLAGDADLRRRMGLAARRTYETKLAPELSYRRLMDIYAAARSVAALKAAS